MSRRPRLTVGVRLTVGEYAQLQVAARHYGCPVRTFVRLALCAEYGICQYRTAAQCPVCQHRRPHDQMPHPETDAGRT